MAEEQPPQEEDIQAVLADLDAILASIDQNPEAAALLPELPPPAEAPRLPAAEEPAPPEVVRPALELKAPAPKLSAPPPAPAPSAVPAPELKIELGPRPAIGRPSEKKAVKAAKPTVDVKPPLELKVLPSASPAARPESVAPQEPAPVHPAPIKDAAPPPAALVPAMPPIPEKAAKDQIRRVVFVYTPNYVKEKDQFAALLAKSAESVSKKPLYLRKVLDMIVEPTANGRILAEKVRAVKGVAVFAVLERFPDLKLAEFKEAMAEAGLMFRIVGVEDVQKRSLAVDVVVDMMLLASEQ